MSIFKSKNNLEKRCNESTNILKKYPDRIPIIVEKYKNSKINDIDKCKYLVPKDMTIGQFLFVIRKRINLDPKNALFITVNNGLVTGSRNIGIIYEDHCDEDGFLYVVYTTENTFG